MIFLFTGDLKHVIKLWRISKVQPQLIKEALNFWVDTNNPETLKSDIFNRSIWKGFVVSATKRRRDIKIPLCLSAPAHKSATFLFWIRNTFLAKFGQKIIITGLTWNLVPGLIQFNGDVHLFCFPLLPFLGKFGPKNQNCQFKLEFDT